MTLPKQVSIVDVGPRDGLQNEKDIVPLQTKIALIQKLAMAGLSTIEAGSFVNPRWVPQMADSDQVYSAVSSLADIQLPVLVPNVKGLEKAIDLGVTQISCFTAASDSFNRKNIACDIEESFTRIEQVIKLAQQHNMRIRAYLSCIVACPYEGKIKSEKVVELSKRLLDMGCYEVSLGDTIGVATPGDIQHLLDACLKDISKDTLALHLHDTYGQSLANILAALHYGIATFDTSISGLGGCPYAPGASGNVATEDVVYMLHGLGINTGIDFDSLVRAGSFISNALNRPSQSKVTRALQSTLANPS